MTGMNVIGYYQTIMNKALRFTGIVQLRGPHRKSNIVFILDCVGRRKPLLFGTIGISLALNLEAALNSQNPDGQRIGYIIGGVSFLFAVSVMFSVSYGPAGC